MRDAGRHFTKKVGTKRKSTSKNHRNYMGVGRVYWETKLAPIFGQWPMKYINKKGNYNYNYNYNYNFKL